MAHHSTDDEGYDSVNAIIRYEAGELNETETIRLFQHLVNNGLAWKLKGHYGRRASELLRAGQIQPPDTGNPPQDRTVDKSRFPLGQTVVTANALDVLTSQEIALGLARHVRGDWGDVCPEDAEANEEALHSGGRLFSVHGEGKRRFWIITEADRQVTTVLLPLDY
jgi:hypothetical protein